MLGADRSASLPLTCHALVVCRMVESGRFSTTPTHGILLVPSPSYLPHTLEVLGQIRVLMGRLALCLYGPVMMPIHIHTYLLVVPSLLSIPSRFLGRSDPMIRSSNDAHTYTHLLVAPFLFSMVLRSGSSWANSPSASSTIQSS